MLLVLEGPDAVGKDTIAEALSNYKSDDFSYTFCFGFSLPTYKMVPKNETESKIRHVIKSYLNKTNTSITPFEFQVYATIDKYLCMQKMNSLKKEKSIIYIVNRFISSAIVYGLVDECRFNQEDALYILNTLHKPLCKPNFDICLMCPLDVILSRLSDRHDISIYETKNKLEFIIDMYYKLYSNDSLNDIYPKDSNIPYTIINNFNRSADDVCLEIVRFIKDNVDN